MSRDDLAAHVTGSTLSAFVTEDDSQGDAERIAAEALPGERLDPYDVFLSASHKDYAWAQWLKERFFRVGRQAFLAPESIGPGLSWRRELNKALHSSRFVLLLITPNAAKSEQCRYEWEVAAEFDLNVEVGRVVPILLGVEATDLPDSLKRRQAIVGDDPEMADKQFAALLLRMGIAEERQFCLRPVDQTREDVVRGRLEAPRAPGLVADAALARRATPTDGGAPIAILGAGYVGVSLAACFADAGYSVVVVERNESKKATLRQGRSHVLEPGVDAILQRVAARPGAIEVRDSLAAPWTPLRVVVVCLGPSLVDDSPSAPGKKARKRGSQGWDTRKFERILKELGESIRQARGDWPVRVVLAGTLRPADFAQSIALLEEFSRSKVGERFVLAVSPLFVREGSILADLRRPPFVVTGTVDGADNAASAAWRELARAVLDPDIDASTPSLCLRADAASVLKLASNAYHALKVSFANEVGRICRDLGFDGREVMDAFVMDRHLNVSAQYLAPGFSYGGWCLDKDIVGLLQARPAPGNGLLSDLPLLAAITRANQAHLVLAVELVRKAATDIDAHSVGVFGLTFKAGSDDIRSSPAVDLIRKLPSAYEVHCCDVDLEAVPLTGVNREEWSDLLQKHKNIRPQDPDHPERIVASCRVLVLAKRGAISLATLKPLLTEAHVLVDLVGEVPRDFDTMCRVLRLT